MRLVCVPRLHARFLVFHRRLAPALYTRPVYGVYARFYARLSRPVFWHQGRLTYGLRVREAYSPVSLPVLWHQVDARLLPHCPYCRVSTGGEPGVNPGVNLSGPPLYCPCYGRVGGTQRPYSTVGLGAGATVGETHWP